MSVEETICPFCGSGEIELVSAWGGQLITSQVRCCRCNTHFEVVREEFAPHLNAAEDSVSPGVLKTLRADTVSQCSEISKRGTGGRTGPDR